jgi:RHS repeat-associated protein
MPENMISGVTQSSDAAPAYPPTGTQTASYNNLNQLTNLSGLALSWDADGNLLSDGTRNYSWDAENRLVAITYPAQPGAQTSFNYDGLGRRTAITGISGVTTSYLWCGSRICQARNASGGVTREYFAEGEFVPGSPAQPYYYGVDQLGSVRRVFAGTTNATAYDYDPYGQPLQTTAPLTDFNYAGMVYNADSGLDLAARRAYDPVAGRWLSRDPTGESSDAVGNLYSYVGGNPISFIDPAGLQGATPPAGTPYPSNIPGGPWTWSPNPQNPRGGQWMGPPPPGGGQRSMCTYAPPGPNNPNPYWKTYNPPPPGSSPGTPPVTQRYDMGGNPTTPEESHPGPSAASPAEPIEPSPTPAPVEPVEPLPVEPTIPP